MYLYSTHTHTHTHAHTQACGAAAQQFEQRKASKQYLALCYGHIQQGGMVINQAVAPFQVSKGKKNKIKNKKK